MAKVDEQDRALEEKLLADGTMMSYGESVNLIHTEGRPTHTEWFRATSEGNILKALAGFYGQADETAAVLAASKHWDHFLVSRIHNERSGKFDGAYISGSMWLMKAGRMDAFEAMVKAIVVPRLEKEPADGAVIFYSVDSEDYHSEVPGLVDVVFAVADAATMDKVNAAFEAAFSKDTEIGPALGALTERDSHRDFLGSVAHRVIR
jgi:hypothetical protein